MDAVVMQEFGDPSVLRLESLDAPRGRSGWVTFRLENPDGIPSTELKEILAELRDLAAVTADQQLGGRLASLTARLEALAGARATSTQIPYTLTPRETQVLQRVALGLTNHGVAVDLGVEVGTVKAYLKSAASKLGAQNRVHAVHLARGLGLIE